MDKLTITEALEAFPDNPQAASMAMGMVLLQSGHEQVNRISASIEEGLQIRINELEAELDYWKPLGKKWLAFKNLLAEPEIFE